MFRKILAINDVVVFLSKEQEEVISFLEKNNYNLSGKVLNNFNFHGVSLKGVKFDRAMLINCNLSRCSDVDWDSFNKLITFVGTNFSGLNVTNLFYDRKDCTGIDISFCIGVNLDSLAKATSISNINFSYLDMGKMNFNNLSCHGIILVGCLNINKSINNAASIISANFSGLDVGIIDYEKKNCKGVKLADSINIRMDSMLRANNIPEDIPFLKIIRELMAIDKVQLIEKFNNPLSRGQVLVPRLLGTIKSFDDFIDSIQNKPMSIKQWEEEFRGVFGESGELDLKLIIDYYLYEQNYQLAPYALPFSGQIRLSFNPVGQTTLKDLTTPLETKNTGRCYHWIEEIFLGHQSEPNQSIQQQRFQSQLKKLAQSYHLDDGEESSLSLNLIRVLAAAYSSSRKMAGYPESVRKLILKYHFAFEQDVAEYFQAIQYIDENYSKSESIDEKNWRHHDNRLSQLQLIMEETICNGDVLRILSSLSVLERSKVDNLFQSIMDESNAKIIEKIISDISKSIEAARVKIKSILKITNSNGNQRLQLIDINKCLKKVGLVHVQDDLLPFEEYNLILNTHRDELIRNKIEAQKIYELGLRDVYSSILQRDIEFVRSMRNKFMSKSGEVLGNKVEIFAEFSKKQEDFPAKRSADVCVAGDLEMWQRPSYLELIFRHKDEGYHLGTVMFEIVDDLNGKSLVLIPNPSTELLGIANNSQVFNKIFEIIVHFANLNHVNQIVRPVKDTDFTNRINYLSFMKTSASKHHPDQFVFEPTIPFSKQAGVSFKKMIVLWKNPNK